MDVQRNSAGKEFHAVGQKMNCQPNVCMFVVQRSPDAMRIAVDRQNRLESSVRYCGSVALRATTTDCELSRCIAYRRMLVL